LDNILGLYRIEWLESKLICADKWSKKGFMITFRLIKALDII
jgi:hypothetical protein